MKGDGFYDAHSTPQRQAIEPYLQWLEKALGSAELPFQPGAPLRLLDIGSSEGANAIFAQSRLVDVLRQRTHEPIEPILSDLPTSDHNRLARNLFRVNGSAFEQPDVYPSVVAGTAYGRLQAAGSVHIATTFNMIGWLSARPEGGLPGYVAAVSPSPYATGADYALSDAETAPLRDLAYADMVAFYRARAAEIPPGGYLLVQQFGSNETHCTAHGIADAVHDTLRQLVLEGNLPEGVYRDFYFPVAYRDLDALLDPLRADPEVQSVLGIECADTFESPVSFNEAFARDGDVAAWARAYTGFVRAFSDALLTTVVLGQGAPESLVDTIYQQLERRLAEDPERYRFHYVSVGALLRRRESPGASRSR